MINLIKKEINLNILLGKMINKADESSNIRFCFVVHSPCVMEYVRSYIPCYHHDKFCFVFPSRLKEFDIIDFKIDSVSFVNESYNHLNAFQLEKICSAIDVNCDDNIYHIAINYIT